jgi:hypothetical protein
VFPATGSGSSTITKRKGPAMRERVLIPAIALLTTLFALPAAQASIQDVFSSGGRNGYVLDRAFGDNGYDWWWHHFTAVSRATGKERPFFIDWTVPSSRRAYAARA